MCVCDRIKPRLSWLSPFFFVQSGFTRKEFRGKLAIAITANFKNRNTTAEAKVEEISGVAFIFNQRFFQELRQDTGQNSEQHAALASDLYRLVVSGAIYSVIVH